MSGEVLIVPDGSLAGASVQTVVDATTQAVQDRFEVVHQYAQGALQDAEAFLQALQNLAANFNFQVAVPKYILPATMNTQINLGDQPTMPVVALEVPAIPEIPSFEEVMISDIGVPVWNGVQPTINIPETPDSSLPGAPGNVPVAVSPDAPTRPAFTLPASPALLTVTIPDVPVANFPTFSDTLDAEALVVPTNVIQINPGSYQSAILTALQQGLLYEYQHGSYGLNPLVENDIYMREYERALLALKDEKDRIAAEWAKRGFELPDGVLVNNLTLAEIDFTNKRLDRARDIALKQAELAYQRGQTIITQILNQENMLITWTNQIAERTFQQTKALQDAGIAIFNASAQKYTLDLEAYKARASVYDTRIRAEIGKAEWYKTQIQAQALASEINKTAAEIYRIQLGAVEALINIYRVDLEASKLKLEVNRLQVEIFKVQVDAYLAQVNAKTAQFNMYNSQIQGQKAKVEIYGEEVKAFLGTVAAIKTGADIKIAQSQAKIESNKNQVALYGAEIEEFKAILQANVEKLTAFTKIYSTDADIFKAKGDVQAALAGVDVKAFEVSMSTAISQLGVFLKQAEININAYQEAQKVKVQAATAGAQINAQIAAGLFSGISVQAHLQAGATVGKSYTASEGASEQHTYPHTERL